MSIRKKLLYSLIVFLLQANVLFGQDAVYLKGYNHFSDLEVQDLRNSVNPSEKININRASFVGGVGGIAFGQLAVPDITVNSIALKYDSAKIDGQRLSAIINGKDVVVPLYDWELKPIFLYADTEYL